MSKTDTLWTLVANINKLVASTQMKITESNSCEDNDSFLKHIDRLNEFKEKVEEEERKLAIQLRNELNHILKERPISKENISKREVLKRKATYAEIVQGNTSKRTRLSERKDENLANGNLEENPFPFATLPDLLQDGIMEKFNYKSFATFDQCSQFSHFLCQDTEKKFYFENDCVEIEGERWKFGMRKNIIATTDQLRKANVHVSRIKTKTSIDDDLALFFISNVKVRTLDADAGISCSQELLDMLLQTLGMENLCVDITESHNYQWNVNHLESVSFRDLEDVSTDIIVNAKPIEQLAIFSGSRDPLKLSELLRRKIKSMLDNGDIFATKFACCFFEPEEVFNVLNEYGERSDGTVNCWALTKGNSTNPLFAIIKSHWVDVCSKTEFYRHFDQYAEFE